MRRRDSGGVCASLPCPELPLCARGQAGQCDGDTAPGLCTDGRRQRPGRGIQVAVRTRRGRRPGGAALARQQRLQPVHCEAVQDEFGCNAGDWQPHGGGRPICGEHDCTRLGHFYCGRRPGRVHDLLDAHAGADRAECGAEARRADWRNQRGIGGAGAVYLYVAGRQAGRSESRRQDGDGRSVWAAH